MTSRFLSVRRAAALAVALLVGAGPAAATAATLVPKAPEGDRACLVCHTTPDRKSVV